MASIKSLTIDLASCCRPHETNSNKTTPIIIYICFIIILLFIRIIKESNKRTKKCLVTVFIAMIVVGIIGVRMISG